MTQVREYFDDLGFSEARCSGFKWVGDQLTVDFAKGVDLGNPEHPLASHFAYGAPCRILYNGVIKSRLKISVSRNEGVSFDEVLIENDSLAAPQVDASYKEYYMEGVMVWEGLDCWFTWDLVARDALLDDLNN